MKLYNCKNASCSGRPIVLDDMIMTTDMPTTAGSRMLAGYTSLFEATAVTLLREAGYGIAGKAAVGEFGFDLIGETAAGGAAVDADGALTLPVAEAVATEGIPALALDTNGAPRRAAAQRGLLFLKPTYGVVSRFGTVPVACSGEAVGVMAKTAAECKEIFTVIAHHDDRDGTSQPEALCESAKVSGEIRRVAVPAELDNETTEALKAALLAKGVELVPISMPELTAAAEAWNILMSAELCNNVSRYDGVKYGYRTEKFTNIDELYTGSRTEAFGGLLKRAILFGSETLSTENYARMYDKALRIRRLVSEAFTRVFGEVDAVLLPAVSRTAYTAEEIAKNPNLAYLENRYTAPASLTGLPSLVLHGAALVAPAFRDGALLSLAEALLEVKK